MCEEEREWMGRVVCMMTRKEGRRWICVYYV